MVHQRYTSNNVNLIVYYRRTKSIRKRISFQHFLYTGIKISSKIPLLFFYTKRKSYHNTIFFRLICSMYIILRPVIQFSCLQMFQLDIITVLKTAMFISKWHVIEPILTQYVTSNGCGLTDSHYCHHHLTIFSGFVHLTVIVVYY